MIFGVRSYLGSIRVIHPLTSENSRKRPMITITVIMNQCGTKRVPCGSSVPAALS